MTRVLRLRVLAAGVGAILLLGGSAPAMAASTAKTAKAPTRDACEAFADYFQIEYLVAFASAFAQLGDKKSAKAAAAEIRDNFHLILSPKLEQVTKTLAAGTDPVLRKLFAQQAATFAKGVALLEGLGLSKDQIQKIATVDLKPDTDLQQVVGEVNLDKQKLKAAVKTFGASAKSVDINEATSKQRAAFSDAGAACGVFPDKVDCSKIVTTDEATALLGSSAKTGNDDGTCTYTGAAPSSPDTTSQSSTSQDPAQLSVDVYDSSLTFDHLTESGQHEAVANVGDQAVAVDGFTAFSSFKTCGRTLITKQAERTVVVAACTGDTAPSTESLAGIATNVLTRLPQA
jgi:hypothetical protein